MSVSLEATLLSLADQVRACEPNELGREELVLVTVATRQLQRTVESLLLRIGDRSSELATAGHGPGPIETMLGSGEVSSKTARLDAARTNVAAAVPALGDALRSGAASGDHLDVVARAFKRVSADERDALLVQGQELAKAAERLPVDTFATHVNRRIDRLRADHGAKTAAQQREASEFHYWMADDGMGHFRGQLDGVRFEALTTAVERHMRALASNPAASENGEQARSLSLDANLAATALVELVDHGNGAQGRAAISLVVDADSASCGPHEHTLSQTARGTTVPPETMDRFACDAVIRRVVLDTNSGEINVGRRFRTATAAQWSVLRALYTSCAWFGCNRPIDWCQAHHIKTWNELGETDLENLIPLCNTHHHQVHEGLWQVRLDPNRQLTMLTPKGDLWKTSKPDRLHEWLAKRRDDDPTHKRFTTAGQPSRAPQPDATRDKPPAPPP